MQIDPKVLIAGQKPSALKTIFRGGGFHTDWFVDKVGKTSSDPLATLAELKADGWILPDPKNEGYWTSTEKADRLVATPLLARLSVKRAHELVEKILAEAQAVNADDTHAYFIAKLTLFGSTATAGPTDTVGDVDIGVALQHRGTTEAERDRMWALDLSTIPDGNRTPTYFWPHVRIMRRLKVERRVSLHDQEEVERGGFGGITIYSFDLMSGMDVIDLPWSPSA